VAADDRTCILFVRNHVDVSAVRWQTTYLGEFYSYVPDDAFCGCVFGAWTGDGLCCSITETRESTAWLDSTEGRYLARNYDGAPGAVLAHVSAHNPYCRGGSSISAAVEGRVLAENYGDGKCWRAPVVLATDYVERCIRGHLRGLSFPCVVIDAFADGDSVVDNEGRTHIYMRTQTFEWPSTYLRYDSALFLETSEPAHL
jgi:hypothetical protein